MHNNINLRFAAGLLSKSDVIENDLTALYYGVHKYLTTNPYVFLAEEMVLKKYRETLLSFTL